MTSNKSHLEFLKLFLKEWRLFAGLSAGFTLFAIGFFLFTKSQVGMARIMINDSQNNTHQALVQSVSGVAKSIIEGKKGNSLLLKQVEYLKSYGFFTEVAKLLGQEESPEYLPLKTALQNQLKDSEDYAQALTALLKSRTSFILESDFMLKVSVSWEEKTGAHLLADLISRAAKSQLTAKEDQETEELLLVLKSSRSQALKNLSEIRKTLKDKNIDSDLILTASASGRIGDYLTELKIRSQEAELNLTENLKMLSFLKKQARGSGAIATSYGVGGKIKALEVENKMLRLKLQSYASTIQQWNKTNENVPDDLIAIEDVKTQAQIEKQKYEELSQAVSKIEVQKASASNRYQLLEPSRMDLVKPRFSFWLIIGFGLFLAQLAGSLVIYVRHLLGQDSGPTEKPAYPYPFDNHLNSDEYFINDPRFSVENGKIRFRADVLDGNRKYIGRIGTKK